ncbi:MAG: hypothetical protein JXX28_01810 [Deltaproteobacteria bacterium]|nr:hypothetical protein [Deltaproteobacteria bacterium]
MRGVGEDAASASGGRLSSSEVLARSEGHRMAGDFAAAALILDDRLLARPEEPGGAFLELLLARARLALDMGAPREAGLRLEEAAPLLDRCHRSADLLGWTALAGIQAGMVGRAEEATRLLWRAASQARTLADRRQEGRAWHNLAMVQLDRRDLVAAEGALAYARALGPDEEYLAAVLALEGLIRFAEGRPLEAAALLDEAHALADLGVRHWVDAGVRTLRGAVRAKLGRLDEAREDLAISRTLHARLPAPAARASVELWAGFLDLAEGQPEGARARLRAARAPWSEGVDLLHADLGARCAARLLLGALGDPVADEDLAARGVIRLPPCGRWLVAGAAEPAEVRSLAARRILVALARAAQERSPPALSASALIEAGWPGEVILRDAALNRLYVAIHLLRRAGLSGVLVTRSDGYQIEAEVVFSEG